MFEGTGGLWDVVGRFEWPLPPASRRMVTQTHLKGLPVCYHGQSAVWAAIELRPRVRVHEISEIQVDTYRSAVIMMANDPTRWAPTNHETADHSMPYVVSIALLDGEVTAKSFAHDRMADPAVINLMRKVKVTENPVLSAQYPESSPNRVSIRMASGDVLTTEVAYPKGHVKNRMDDAAVEAKFRDLFRDHGDAAQCERALRGIWNFDQAPDIGKDVRDLLARPSNPV